MTTPITADGSVLIHSESISGNANWAAKILGCSNSTFFKHKKEFPDLLTPDRFGSYSLEQLLSFRRHTNPIKAERDARKKLK